MSTRFVLASAAFITALSLAAGAQASTNIVLNPGFETGSLAPWVSNTNSNHPWGIGPVDIAVHSGNFDAQTGCVGAQCTDETNPASAASLTQTLSTTGGTTYNLSFWFAGNGAQDELKVLWGGGVVLDLVNAQIVSNPGPETEYFVNGLHATGGSTDLTFLGRQDPGYNGLDDVSVVAATAGVPEPATWAMLLLGFAGIGVAARSGAKRRAITAA